MVSMATHGHCSWVRCTSQLFANRPEIDIRVLQILSWIFSFFHSFKKNKLSVIGGTKWSLNSKEKAGSGRLAYNNLPPPPPTHTHTRTRTHIVKIHNMIASSIPARSHTFVDIDHEIISKVNRFIQEGLLLVRSESMCTNYWLTASSSLEYCS